MPASAQAAPVKAEFTAIAPPPDPNAAAEIAAQAKEADTAEAEVAGQAGGPAATPDPAPAAAPAEIGIGQTIDQVVAILGKPKTIVDLGTKKTYIYSDMKIIFTAGKVSGVE